MKKYLVAIALIAASALMLSSCNYGPYVLGVEALEGWIVNNTADNREYLVTSTDNVEVFSIGIGYHGAQQANLVPGEYIISSRRVGFSEGWSRRAKLVVHAEPNTQTINLGDGQRRTSWKFIDNG